MIEHANKDEFGGGLTLQMSSNLRQVVQNILGTCPLINLQALIKLYDSLNQSELAKFVLVSIGLLQSGK